MLSRKLRRCSLLHRPRQQHPYHNRFLLRHNQCRRLFLHSRHRALSRKLRRCSLLHRPRQQHPYHSRFLLRHNQCRRLFLHSRHRALSGKLLALQPAARAQATAPIPQQVSTPARRKPQAPLAQPRQNLMHELRAAIPQQQPVQPLTIPGMVSPLPLTSKVQNLQRLIRHNLHNHLKMLRMRGMNRFISNKTAPSVQQLKVQEQQSTLMRQQDIMQEAIKAHIAKPPKQLRQSTENQR